MVLSSLPPPLSPSLPFSLSPVQHPGLKILRSDSSSSISSRIGWTSPLSLTLSPSPNCLSFLCPLCFGSFLFLSLVDSVPDFFSLHFFLLPLSSSSLVCWFGLVAVPCWLWYLTNVVSPHCSAPPLSWPLLPFVDSHASSDILTCFRKTLFRGSPALVRTPVVRLCECVDGYGIEGTKFDRFLNSKNSACVSVFSSSA